MVVLLIIKISYFCLDSHFLFLFILYFLIIIFSLHFRYWNLCTQTLSTPLLLSAGYKSVQNEIRKVNVIVHNDGTKNNEIISRENDNHDENKIKNELLTSRIIGHIYSALKNVVNYTSTAMEDVITTIKDLCDAKCIELLPIFLRLKKPKMINESEKQKRGKTHGVSDFPNVLLKAYKSHPRSPLGRIVDQIPWKVSAITALTDVFRLSSFCFPVPLLATSLPASMLTVDSLSEGSTTSNYCNIGNSSNDNSNDDNNNNNNNDNKKNDYDNYNNDDDDDDVDDSFLAAVEFTKEFLETVCEDMLLLYRAMGTISDPNRKYAYTNTFVRSSIFL